MPQFRFPRVACLALILTLLAHAVAAASDAVLLQPGKPGRTIGSVDWSRGWAADGAPTLVGHAKFPGALLSVDLVLYRNTDRSMPATHLFDIRLAGTNQRIKEVGDVSLRASSRGDAAKLFGAGARVDATRFLYALSASPRDIRRNIVLLAKPGWLDVGLKSASGARGHVLLDLDAGGHEAIVALLGSGS